MTAIPRKPSAPPKSKVTAKIPSSPLSLSTVVGQDVHRLVSPEEKGAEQPTKPPASGELPIWDDNEVTTFSQDSADPPVSTLLAPAVAAMLSEPLPDITSSMDLPVLHQQVPLSLPLDASFAAVSPASP